MLTRCGSVWAFKEQDAALRYAKTIKEASSYAQFMQGIIEGVAMRDPEAAATLFNHQADKNLNNRKCVSSIIEYWCGYNPNAAGDWITTFSDEQLKQQATEQLLEYWNAEEPEEAEEWSKSIQSDCVPDETMVK
jgi:hypothetical protein